MSDLEHLNLEPDFAQLQYNPAYNDDFGYEYYLSDVEQSDEESEVDEARKADEAKKEQSISYEICADGWAG